MGSLRSAAALLAAAWLAGCAPAPPEPTGVEPPRPDIVLVSLDTVRWDHTTLSGYDRPTTPVLAEFARLPGATTFDRAYTGAAWSLPAYASLFTGLDAMTHSLGFTMKELDPAQTTLPEVLRAYGYRTAAFTSGPHLHPSTGLQRGFDDQHHIDTISPMAPVVNRALRWIDSGPDQPFFLFVVGYDAHTPYASPSAYAEIFDPDYDGFLHQPSPPAPDDPCKLRGATRTCLQALPGVRADGTVDPIDLAHVVAHYDSAVRAADYGLGRLLDGLEARGLLEDAVIIVLADHGEGLGEVEGRFHHDDQVGDRVFHVPLVIRLPHSEARARRSDALVSLTNLTPTLLEYLQMQPPAGATGRSFLAATGLPSSANEPGDPVVIGASLCCYWARTRDWQLQGHSDRHEPELPMTWKLLADDEGPDQQTEEPEIFEQLRARLAPWPHHPGRYGKLEVGRDTEESETLKKALRMGGYWTPTAAAPTEGAAP